MVLIGSFFHAVEAFSDEASYKLSEFATSYAEAGSLFFGSAPDSSEMICSGTLVGCDWVLTAAHCLIGMNDGKSRYWFFLQHAGMFEVDLNSSIGFCENNDCSNRSGKLNDLFLIKLRNAVNHIQPPELAKVDSLTDYRFANFVGFGDSLPGRHEWNLKRWALVQPKDCVNEPADDRFICYDLGNRKPGACHRDSGGPLFSSTIEGEYFLLGVSIKTGTTCRVGQARYNRLASSIFGLWLSEKLLRKESQCSEPLHVFEELFSEPSGYLSSKKTSRTFEIDASTNLKTLIVTMNHSPGKNRNGETRDFDLELSIPQGAREDHAPQCDNTWGLVSVCRVENPAPGMWEANVTSIHGEGHFQLVASGISR